MKAVYMGSTADCHSEARSVGAWPHKPLNSATSCYLGRGDKRRTANEELTVRCAHWSLGDSNSAQLHPKLSSEGSWYGNVRRTRRERVGALDPARFRLWGQELRPLRVPPMLNAQATGESPSRSGCRDLRSFAQRTLRRNSVRAYRSANRNEFAADPSCKLASNAQRCRTHIGRKGRAWGICPAPLFHPRGETSVSSRSDWPNESHPVFAVGYSAFTPSGQWRNS